MRKFGASYNSKTVTKMVMIFEGGSEDNVYSEKGSYAEKSANKMIYHLKP
ncbi:MAG: hypothetical protein ACLRPW_03920 [Intestinibacter sp.]